MRKRVHAVGGGQSKGIRKRRIARISRILQHMSPVGTQGDELPTRKEQRKWEHKWSGPDRTGAAHRTTELVRKCPGNARKCSADMDDHGR